MGNVAENRGAVAPDLAFLRKTAKPRRRRGCQAPWWLRARPSSRRSFRRKADERKKLPMGPPVPRLLLTEHMLPVVPQDIRGRQEPIRLAEQATLAVKELTTISGFL